MNWYALVPSEWEYRHGPAALLSARLASAVAPRREIAMRSGRAFLKIAGLLGVALGSSWIALQLFDYWDVSTVGSRNSSIPNVIEILEATYGSNCPGQASAVKPGNATSVVAKICEKAIDDCKFVASVGDFGDPAPGCAKELRVTWHCASDQSARRLRIPPEADGKLVFISCLN
jgi:hypothetical protein